MEHVELETLDRGTTEHKQTSPPSDHKKKPTNKAVTNIETNWNKNSFVCFYYFIYCWFQCIIWSDCNLFRSLCCNSVVNVLKMDIGIKHTQVLLLFLDYLY